MTKKIRCALTLAGVAIVFTAAALAAQGKVDLTGKWVFDVQTEAGGGTPTVTFKQDGEKLSGHYSSATFGENDFTGSVKGQSFTFKFDADVGGQAVSVSYSGTVESRDAVKGTIEIVGLGSGTFTGKRQ
jgi:hypothetical protein